MFFLFPRLEHPAGWICARYKSLLLLLLRTEITFVPFGHNDPYGEYTFTNKITVKCLHLSGNQGRYTDANMQSIQLL